MARRTKLPKTVMGVKIPKDLRKRGEKLLDAADSPAGREMMAGVMGVAAAAMGAIAAKNAAAAAAASASATKESAAKEDVAPPPPASPPPEPAFGRGGTTREPDFQAIAETIGRNVEMALERVFGAKRA